MKTFSRAEKRSKHKDSIYTEQPLPNKEKNKTIKDFLSITERELEHKPGNNSEAENKKSDVQMVLSFGQKIIEKCHFCGVEYSLASKEDVSLHKKVHRRMTREREKRDQSKNVRD